MVDQTPQLPDPFANMPAVGGGIGGNLMQAAQAFGDNLMAIIEEAGNRIAGAVGLAVSSVSSRGGPSFSGGSVSSPMQDGFIAQAPASPQVVKAPQVEAPTVALPPLQRSQAHEVSAVELGSLSPPATPSMGVSQGQGRGI